MPDKDLLTTIRRVRGRWKLALILRGAAICIVAALALLALSAAGFGRWGFEPSTVLSLRVAVGFVAFLVFVVFVLWPALRRISDHRVALYIEEREPALQSLLISAIETPAADSGLARALIESAASKCRDLDFGSGIERKRVRRNTGMLAAAALIALVILGAGPNSMRRAARLLLLPANEAAAARVMSISVEPGDRTIARGSDLAVHAQLNAFTAQDAFVVMRAGNAEWQRWSMSQGQKDGTFEAVLFDVATDMDYFIESGSVRSPTFRIKVVAAPFVSAIAHEYMFPAYTGLGTKRVENGADIVAPKGTVVRVIASTSAPVEEGRLRLEHAGMLRMLPNAKGGVATAVRVGRDDLYHIELPGIDGKFTSASAQYAITALPDQPPTVTIDKPARDIKVTSVDEVFVSASAQDDYGIRRLELVYSVNGGAQQVQSLATPQSRTPDASGAHTFFLEELSLQPGDFVSYFVRASDNNAIDGAKTTSTDIYFIQIKPFSREYRAAEQAGAPGGGGEGGEDPGALSERQRQIIAATFNVSRDRPTYTEQGFAEAITTIELSQRKLREQVNTLVQRMRQRGVVGMDSIFAQIAQLLPQAATEMSAAESRLQQRNADEALGPEQRALQQLLRAEALYREVQVQMQQQQQQGGGGGESPPDDLADLFDLERDQLRNQYEQVQRSREEQAQRQVDEALERLRELARRQQQEAERQRQAASAQSQQQQQGAGGTGGAQRRLADEAEQTARQLERLARENNDPQLGEAARRLQDAANAMRRASGQQNGRGLAEANAAREQLEEARRRLQNNQRESLQERVAEAQRRAEELREQHRRNEAKDQLGRGVGELEQRLDRLSAEARSSNRETSRQLQGAADAIRDSRLRERIASAQNNAQFRSPEFNRAQEEQIARDLNRVTQQLDSARQSAGSQSPESQTRDAADRARALAQAAEGMRGRAENGNQPGAGRQLRAEARARAGELQELRRQMQQQGYPTGALDGAIQSLRGLQNESTYNDPQEVERLLAAVARGLENFEFDLRQRLDESQVQKLHLSGEGQVPARFRKAVEEYYRSLARRSR